MSGKKLTKWQRVLMADPCAYCGAPACGTDHIVARSRGGTNDWTNLTGTCNRCNSGKRTKSLLAYLGFRMYAPEWRALEEKRGVWNGVGA